MDVLSSNMGLMLFGFHAGNVHIVNNTHGFLDDCSSWVLVWSGNLKYISGTILFPIYIWLIFSYLHRQIPRIFARLLVGTLFYLLGDLCVLFIDLIRLIKHHCQYKFVHVRCKHAFHFI